MASPDRSNLCGTFVLPYQYMHSCVQLNLQLNRSDLTRAFVGEMLRWTFSREGSGPRRAFHAAVAVAHNVYSFGGFTADVDDISQMDVHVFNTVSLQWSRLPPARNDFPSMRYGHTAVLLEDIIYLWGGMTYKKVYCSVTYGFSVDTHAWFKPEVTGAVPEKRFGHSACVSGTAMYIFGGHSILTPITNDTYVLDTATAVWSSIPARGSPPLVSFCHSSTIIGTKVFVFGGQGEHSRYNNVMRAFDTETNIWTGTTSSTRPQARCGHSTFVHDGELYLFGGHSGERTFGDLWKFTPEDSTWRSVVPRGRGPCSRLTIMRCCTIGDRVILGGGFKDCRPADDLYILDLSPSLKTLCRLAVVQYGLQQSQLPRDIRWELETMMTTSSN